MRINVYQEEILYEMELVWVEPYPGKRFCGVRIFLKSHPDLHHEPGDDDRTAITFWLNNPMAAERYFTKVAEFVKVHSLDDPEATLKRTYRSAKNYSPESESLNAPEKL